MAFVNMKKPKKKPENNKVEVSSYDEGDRYPYGLEISLDEDSLKKLKLGAGNFKVKETFQIVSKVKVISVSARDSMRSGTNDRVELQITDLDLGERTPKKSLFTSYNEIQNADPS